MLLLVIIIPSIHLLCIPLSAYVCGARLSQSSLPNPSLDARDRSPTSLVVLAPAKSCNANGR
jgi:hypothetical protein